MEVFDNDKNLRATISGEGEVKNSKGATVGFINEDGTAGDVNENFLGEVASSGQVIDSKDNILGKVDFGTAEVRDNGGGHFFTISSAGELTDSLDGYRGKVDDFTFHKTKVVVAYVFFFDAALIDGRRSSKVTIEEAEQSTLSFPGAPSPSSVEHQEESLTLDLPPPKPASSSSGKVEHESITLTLPTPAPKKEFQIQNRQYKAYKVGDFKTVDGGKKNLLEITCCDCPIEQLSIRIEKAGKELVFQRTTLTGDNKKQQVQRFALPYALSLARITAEYSEHSEEGKLVLTLTKPAVSSSGGQNGEFNKLVVPATPSASPDSKVSIKAGQSSSYFQFDVQGQSVHETEIVGELSDGENVKFHTIVTVESEGVRKKATQTFTLPFKVSVDHIECTDGGKVTKVHSKPVRQTAGQSAHAEEPVQNDVDVPLKKC